MGRREKAVLLGGLCAAALAGQPQAETITLSEPDAVATARAVSDAIDAMSDRVMACIEAGGGTPATCLCANAEGVAALETAYRTAIRRYPEWRDRIVFFRIEGDPTGYNIAFDGVRRHVETEPCAGQ